MVEQLKAAPKTETLAIQESQGLKQRLAKNAEGSAS